MIDVTITDSTAPKPGEPGSPEYESKMAETGTTPDTTAPEDKLLAGKFKTQDDLMKSIQELGGDLEKYYKYLESKRGKPEENQPPPQDEKTVENVLEKTGLNLAEFNDEFMRNGELSPESYEKLTKAGFPKDLVDAYIEGQKAVAAQLLNSFYDRAGGKESFEQMATWAAKGGLTSDEIRAFNNTLDSNDSAKIFLAIDGLKARFEKAFGREGRLYDGSAETSLSGYGSWEEVTRDMADKRYATDPAFRRAVEAKLKKSNL